MTHIANLHTRPDALHAPLYVVTCVFNPNRYSMRWSLYHKFSHYIQQSGAILYTVEIAFGDRDFAVTDATNSRHLQLRTSEVLWHKERALNLLIQRLPIDWKYLAWIDADVTFARTDWVNETLHQLQFYPIVQMFHTALDLDYNHRPLQRHLSFSASHAEQVRTPSAGVGQAYGSVTLKAAGKEDVQAWHPGFAWAMTRAAYDTVGGLFDPCITGAGDNHMGKSLLGDAAHSCNPNVSPGYMRAVLKWQARALQLHGHFGYMDGTLMHYWHGPKVNRQYWNRWKILTETQFDPADLSVDACGLYRLPSNATRLRRLLLEYFGQRNEDAIT